MQKLDRLMIKYILFIAMVFLIVSNYQQALDYLLLFINILSPIIVGIVMAYILNILMVRFERLFLKNTQHHKLNKARRPLSILLAICTISLALVIVMGLVMPQLLGVLTTLIEAIPVAFEQIQGWLTNSEQKFPEFGMLLDQLEIDWPQIVRNAVAFFNGVTARIIESTLAVLGSMASVVINLVLSLIISIYILSSKEQLLSQADRVIKAYFTKKRYGKIRHVLSVLDASFRHFVTGEVLEAFVLGTMVTVGMWIFRFPYATMLGALTGVMALIPMLGAWISGTIGFILIGVQSPVQGFAFLLFIIFVQQAEGNIIYPKIVGDKIGLPGMWVLIAVTVGAGFGGITGMLLSVPVASAVYKLLKENVARHERLS